MPRNQLFRCAMCVLGLLFTINNFGAFAQGPVGKRPVDRVKRDKAPAEETTRKIVGGEPAPVGKYPFQVALIVSDIGVGREHFGQFCGGTLIARNWVLTAAHCVPNTKPSEVDVYIGSTLLPSGQDSSNGEVGQRLHVTEIVSHQDYDPDTKNNDIALLKLQNEAAEKLTPALIATADLEKLHAKEGSTVTVIGWGATAEGGNTTPKLMEVNVKVQGRSLCEDNYKSVVPSARISDNMFCAGLPEGKADSCQGDSGGFLGASIGQGRYVELGVVSWGIGCARPNLFGVYTRVAKYSDWVQTVMKSF